MKQLITLFAFFALTAVSIGQTVYESPCVQDGKTFQITIPEGFFKLEAQSIMRTTFSTEETLSPDFGSAELSKMALGSIVVYYESRYDNPLEWYIEEIESVSDEMNSSFELLNPPEIVEINGREFLFAASKGTVGSATFNVLYVGYFPFGERIVKVGYFATEKLTEFMAFDEFKEIFSSVNEVETNKEDCVYDDIMDEALKIMEDELRQYTKSENNLFETELSSSGISLIVEDGWNKRAEASAHLLEEYIYKQDKGSIQVFSGGRIEDYPGTKEMELAIQKVLESDDIPTITYHSKCSSDYNSFKKYSVSGSSTVTSVYIAEIEKELVFFLIDEGLNPDSDFKSAAHDYIMLFSFINWDDYPPSRAEPAPPPPGPPSSNGGH